MCMVVATAMHVAAADIDPAVAAALPVRPAALAALDAMPLADLAVKTEKLGLTPAKLRALVQTSEAVQFDADTGSLIYR